MSKLITGGLKYKSDYVFNSHFKHTHQKEIDKMAVDTESLMSRLYSALLKDNILSEDKVQKRRVKTLLSLYSTVTSPDSLYTTSLTVCPIIRGLDVAFYYSLVSDQYQLVGCKVTNEDIISKVKDPDLLDISESILAWVKFFDLTETVTVPSTINPNNLNELGLRLMVEGDSLPSHLRVDATLTVKTLDYLDYKKGSATIEALIRGWLNERDKMIKEKYPKMVAVANRISANSGLLSKKFEPTLDILSKSIDLFFVTQCSMMQTLKAIGFNVPYYDMYLEENNRYIDDKFVFGNSMFSALEFTNAWLFSIAHTNRALAKIKTVGSLLAFKTSLTTEDLSIQSNFNYLKSSPYTCVGVCIRPSYIFLDNKQSNPIAYRLRVNEDILAKVNLGISRILGMSYDQCKLFIKATGYDGSKNPVTRATEKLLATKYDIEIDYARANELFKHYLPIFRKQSEVLKTEKLFTKRPNSE